MAHVAQNGELEVPLELQEPEWQFYRKLDAEAVKDGAATAGEDGEKKEKVKEGEMEVEQPQASTSAAAATAPAPVSTPGPARRTSFAAHLATPSAATSSSANAPSTPGPTPSSASPKPHEGLTSIHLPNLRTTSLSTVDILLDLVSTHTVPEPDRLNLLQKIRIGKALNNPSLPPRERQQLLIVRLLALSVFAHSQPENQAQVKVFLYEPELIPQLAELVHPERNDISTDVKAAALYALEAFARYKGKTAEVASALNASVSHGVLLELVRKTATDLNSETRTFLPASPSSFPAPFHFLTRCADFPSFSPSAAESTPELIDALFNLLTWINMHQTIGVMVIGAGVIGVLLEFVKNRKRDHLVASNKAVVLLDGFLYGYANATTAYIAAGGLNVFIERIKVRLFPSLPTYCV